MLYGEYGLVNLIGLIPSLASSDSLSLRESRVRENCMHGLSGGRRPARKRASSDPTGHVVGKASEALRCRKAESTDRPSRERWLKARTRREASRTWISEAICSRTFRLN